MIIFFNKQTGKIVGTINGRVHKPEHLNMYIGSPEENGRIVCGWTKNKNGIDFIPDSPIFSELENTRNLSDFIVDVETHEIKHVN